MDAPSEYSPPSGNTQAFLKVSRLHSIKTKILTFTLVATVIPALTLGTLFYLQNTGFLNEKISQELRSNASQISRELDLWIKERLYDIRVFSSSYIVSENLAKISRHQGSHVENLVSLNLIKEYLRSVRQKFVDYKELVIVDLNGDLVATSSSGETVLEMPPDWIEQVRRGEPIIGEPYLDPILGTQVMLIAEPILTSSDGLMGVVGAKLSVKSVNTILESYAQSGIDEVYLVNRQGTLLVGKQVSSSPDRIFRLDEKTARALFGNPSKPMTYSSYHGTTVIGAMNIIPSLAWGGIVEVDREKAFIQVWHLQRLTLALVGGLLVGLGLCAYLLGLAIVRPLNRLSRGADQVAAGDLQVDLPVSSRSEAGYLTQVFNHMVARLRRNREVLASVNAALKEKNRELHQLSITDGLTGLYNRKHLMETLEGEVIRSKRHNHAFTLLIIDIDHFKMVNDNYGHQKGDAVLCRLAEIFTKAVRDSDYVARYGGEEFIALLTETEASGGLEVAERIRQSTAEKSIDEHGASICVTVSIGMAVFPDNGEDPQTLIHHADKALYTAKEAGRNRVEKLFC